MKEVEYRSIEEENEALREKLRFYQEYDLLTGLYNKNAFYREAEKMLEQSDIPYNIICVDVERFKLVNDLFGTERGDDLLRYLAKELNRGFGRETTALARLSADVFALCLPSGGEQAAEETILQIFRNYSLEMEIVPAIGVYQNASREIRVSLMCDRAIMALRSVKGDYVRHVAYYNRELRDVLLEEQELLNNVDSALLHKEFKIYFQPKCNMITGNVVGAEALVRWLHPVKGLIAPQSFIPMFERNGFIKKLDRYVWEETAAWLRRRLDAGKPVVPISVNVSRIDVFGMDVAGVLHELMEKYQLEPDLLELEITESAYTRRPEEVIRTLEKLMSGGFTVLMDDFGSGYSSLNMLKDTNVDILKMDMRFLDRDDQKSKNILESVVHMSKWLNLPVIAEGVETKAQVDFLLKIGCLYAQGFYYYRPMPVEDFEALLVGGKVDFEEGNKLSAVQDKIISFEELLHDDVLSDRLLNDILGAVALYEYSDEKGLHVVRGNTEYYRLTHAPGRTFQSEEEVLSKIDPLDQEHFLKALRQAKNTDSNEGVEVFVRQNRSDRVLWLQMRLFHLSETGDADLFYGSLADSTVLMEAMEGLRLSEQRFQIAMEATGIAIFELDIRTRVARYSEYVQRNFGLDATVANAPEGFIEQGTVSAEYEDDFRGIYEAIYRGEDKASCVIRANMGDGSIVWNRITLTAVKDQNGHTVKAVGMVENVTREKELEIQLGRKTLDNLSKANQEVLVSLLGSAASSGMVGGYQEGEFPLYFVNEDMIAMLGFSSYEDLMECTSGLASKIIYNEDFERVREAVKNLPLNQEYKLRFRLKKKEGKAIPVSVKGCVVLAEDGRRALVNVCVDITEQTELAHQLEAVINNAPGDVVIFRHEGERTQMQFVSTGLGPCLGYEPQEYRSILEDNYGANLVYPIDRGKVAREFRKASETCGPVDVVFRSIHKDGTVGWTSLKARCWDEGSEGGTLVYHGIFTDITQLKQQLCTESK